MADHVKELSIFVDESGSFDSQTIPSRFYVVSLVFHDQLISIAQRITALEETLARIGHPALCFHAGPIIRREDEFSKLQTSFVHSVSSAPSGKQDFLSQSRKNTSSLVQGPSTKTTFILLPDCSIEALEKPSVVSMSGNAEILLGLRTIPNPNE